MYKHILLPTDGSPLSARAVAAGVKLAKAVGARVTGVFGAPAPPRLVYARFGRVGYLTLEPRAALIERAAARYLGVIEKAAKSAGVPCECVRITSDFPADVILQTATKRRCDLIVMASHGRRGLSAVLLGSETQKVLTHAKLPVLVYR